MWGLSTIRRVSGELKRDVAAVRQRDPAATGVSTAEILTSWPGLHALLAHRVAHALDAARIPIAPRALAYVARALTGIEIHPAARIGDGLGRKPEGPDADWVHLPDPIADALKLMSARVAELEREVAAWRGEEPSAPADVVPLRPVRGPSPAGG
jgi:hypothetical protein